MAKRLIILHTLFLFLSINQYSHADELNFHGFKNAANKITLNGAAQIEHNGILKLTNDTPRLVGHAFYAKPIKFKNSKTEKAQSFSTSFVFAIVPEYKKLGGHGLAFAISKSKELNGALPSQYLGLVNASTIGNFSNHVFAVEFDTVQDFEFGDINDNHVGVDFNSLISNASVTASGSVQGNSTEEQEVNLKSGERIQVWIDYDSIKQGLNVSLSVYSTKPSSPILEYPVDLSPIFEEYMYVGFSASTGLLASSHYVFGWSFVMEGQAESLDLSLLPSFPVLKQNHMPVILGVCLSFAAFMVIIIVVSLYLVKKIKNMDVIEPWELDVGPHRFSYKELKQATRGFRDKELIGFGGFGRVYKGKLPHSNTLVAVKRINHESKQGLHEFVSEIASIGRLRHRNLVQLLGWCRRRDDLLLVYDYMPNGSLDKYIFDKPKRVLTWEQRLKIIRDVASGLLYLHEEWEEIVIHRDVKAGNVLLDSEMNGRLGDFGLAKLYEHGENPSTTKVVGTLGYLAPELTKTGKPTTSSDVYAFGALLLEVVCGRRPVDAKAAPEELILVDWVWEKWTDGSILEVLDPRLAGEFDEVEAIVVLKLGLMCSNNDPSKRPNMRQVVRYLHWEVALPEDLATPDEYCAKNVDKVSAIGAASEDFVHSFPSSSNHDKVSTLSSECDGEEDVDLEDGSRLQSSKVMGAVLAGQKT